MQQKIPAVLTVVLLTSAMASASAQNSGPGGRDSDPQPAPSTQGSTPPSDEDDSARAGETTAYRPITMPGKCWRCRASQISPRSVATSM
jgi:hypothetical protein